MERYTGFYIDKPQGNNVFSYEERENKKIFVPKLIEGTLEDVKVGDNIVFNEIDEDTEIKAKGLKNLVEYKLGNKTIYVFDNHNHAFYFWNKSLLKNEFNNLDDKSKEIALLRLEYPDMSLVELGKKLKEPLGKSGVNYRLKRIIKIAEDL